MDRRVFLALLLSAVVVILTQVLFPPSKQPARADSARADSARVAAATATADSATPAAEAQGVTAPPPAAAAAAPATTDTTPAVGRTADTAVVETDAVRYRVSSLGARPVGVELKRHAALDPRGNPVNRSVELVRPGDAIVGYRVVAGGDTISLADVPFTVTRTDDPRRPRLDYRATLPSGMAIAIAYTFAPDSYMVRVEGRVENAPQPVFVLAELPRALASYEADTVEDSRMRAIAYKPTTKDAVGVPFNKLKPAEPVIAPGPHTWVVAKSKYFIVGFLTPEGDTPFRGAQVSSARTANVSGFFGSSLVTTAAIAAAVEELPADGRFAFEIYAGPQEFERMAALGRDFEESNPYGGWLQGIVQPFATIVMRTLLWMKRNLGLSYGWILVIFGVVVRLAIWPFQQKAMRSSMVMQRIQPQLQAVQEKYRNDPQRLQQEMFKVYKEHGVSPFSAFSGCLPMLIPMPVFFALFFVFQNTIEFRGVPFLWLTDISLYDPLFIIPVLMGLSSWLLAWIGMRNAPPNPQAKMMSYMFPAMMTVFLWKFASGLNLYYTVQNVAALPQQWLLARERGRQTPIVPKK